ncbi:uncharacterized protein Dmoj_GI13911 [Drosophila mojavensis]|uniref:Uncharacterized protein n=1 Tax=Drosophila mojavensis TaxID=7230 RepID=B4KX25_DROMO|nr:uncharacterized protein Dmoj_GI13911 [Drosophila mojavensis]
MYFQTHLCELSMRLFEHDIDYCVVLKGSQDTIYRRLFISTLRFGNFSRTCPIKSGYYYLHGWKIVIIQAGESKYSHNYFENFNMSIINNTLNLDMMIRKPLTHGLKMRVDFSISLGKSKHYQSVFANIVDVCGVVSAIHNNIFKTWFQSMLEHGNFMYNCPVTEGHYFLRNWRMEAHMVPQYLYAGDYRVNCHMFFGKLKTKHEDFVVEMKIFALLKSS